MYVCRNTSVTPEPPVYLSARACNTCCNVLGYFLHHAGKITHSPAIQTCRHTYPYLFVVYLHETEYFPYRSGCRRSRLSVCIQQETKGKGGVCIDQPLHWGSAHAKLNGSMCLNHLDTSHLLRLGALFHWNLHGECWVSPVLVPDLPFLGISQQHFHPCIIRFVHMKYVHQTLLHLIKANL